MILDCKLSKTCTARLATARLDREFVADNSAGFVGWAAAQFHSTITFRIPVGYQDDTGFHCGIQYRHEPSSFACVRAQQQLSPDHFESGVCGIS
jgi:hypothetical protein